jgi:hypothetical protein
MRKTYSILIEPQTVTRTSLRNTEQFLTELSSIDGVEVSEDKLELVCDSEKEEALVQLSEKYSIVNLIATFNDEKL